MTTRNLGEEGFRWFIGIVEDVNDPKKLGRAKVRVINDSDDLDTQQLDWSHVMMPATSACVDGVGDSPNLSVGSRVVGFYMDGNEKQQPMILGTFPTIPSNDENRHSLSWLHRELNVISKELVGPEPPSAYAAEYPFNRTITTRAGHAIEIDDTPENNRIHIYHTSGAYIEINNEGRVVIKSPVDSFDITGGNKQIYVKGDCNVESAGDVLVKSGGDVTIDTSLTKITGDVEVAGNVVAQGEVTGKGVKLSTHTHGGVETGGSNTTKPN